MLSTVLGFPGDMSHCPVLALKDPGFSQGLLPPWSQTFGKIGYEGVLFNIIDNIK